MNRFELYLNKLEKTQKIIAANSGKNLEHPHRPALKNFLEIMLPGVEAVNEPGKDERGAVDFALIKNRYPIGYVEAKAISEDLDKVAAGEQLKRYFGYANLILTDHLEFRFYKHGVEYEKPIRIADPDSFVPDSTSCELLEVTIRAFLEDAAEPVQRAGHLAKIMGEHGKRIAVNLVRFLKTDSAKNKPILEIYEVFKSQLVHDLSFEAFADMYAQTLVYGLFVARYHDESKNTFSRAEARDLIPRSNPLLQRFFDHIAGADFDDRLKPIVDDLCKVFGNADVKELMQQIYKQDLWGTEYAAPDPVIHFYEDFLQAYDPKERKALGAYYTPPAVVRFIVRSVDTILKRDFDLAQGLADTKKIHITRTDQGRTIKHTIHQVQVLDPATGTGTFLNETVRLIRRAFTGQEGRFGSYVNDDLLPRIHGFEIMMAPYTIAHLKLAATLRESGAKDLNARLGIYLTNSLEKSEVEEHTLFASLGLARSISDESRAASRIKNDTPIMVIIGNPPYSGESSNKEYTGNNVYKVEPGTVNPLQERNSKWINDDYVKFIHLAESLIETDGGVVGMITAHGYLDNPTFRGMRYHLMQTFSEIYVLDLHGNSNKKEKTPEGGKDENVFAIKQGVAILLGIRRKGKRSDSLAKVFRADCWGTRKAKFECLDEMQFEAMEWKKLNPQAKSYEWVARDEKTKAQYVAGISIKDLFIENGNGVVTARDVFVIGDDGNALISNAERFRDLRASTQAALCTEVGISNKKGWDALKARAALQSESDLSRFVREIAYRPFDTRLIFYHPSLIWRMADKTMKHMIAGENFGLVSARTNKNPETDHFFVSDTITEAKLGESSTQSALFPLYVFAEDGTRFPNLNRDIVKRVAADLGSEPSPEAVFDYIYAVLHSPKYRAKYKEFLKIDYPRVPYPKDKGQFDALVSLGKELRELHLLKSPKVRHFITSYPPPGNNKVEKITRKGDKVYINAEQCFESVPEEAWTFYIGGYQPAQKWLKDRLGRTLTSEEIEHYQRMIVALTETDRVMAEIDKMFTLR